MKIHPVVHIAHTFPYDEHPEDIAPAEAGRLAPVPTIEEKEHVVNKIMSLGKRKRISVSHFDET